MISRLLIVIAAGAALALAGAPAASADQTIAVDVTATHNVVWNSVEAG
jgi:ABC-type sugar transport system substrate-binding protein